MQHADWSPDPADAAASRIAAFALAASAATGRDLGDYDALQRWSVEDVDGFWRLIARDLGIEADGPVLAEERLPGARWLPGARLNYAERVLRGSGTADRDDEVAVVGVAESGLRSELTWAQLRMQCAALADELRAAGVGPGDRVVGYLPHVPQTVIALLATASLGAVWSVCGTDYSASAALSRFDQLDPVVLVAGPRTTQSGRVLDRSAVVAEIADGLPTLARVLDVEHDWPLPLDAPADGREPVCEQVGFDHPLWVLFSSGTTGMPKGIVHGHGGAALEQYKTAALHFDLGPGERLLWHTTPSWMMWNFVVGGLLTGAAIVCYDGSPAHPRTDALWAVAAEHAVTVLGASPPYVAACQKAGLGPAGHDLSRLRRVGISGSTFPAESQRALAADLPRHVQIASISGGTDVVSAFVGAAPTTPVWAGELSRPCLGVALAAFSPAGEPVRGEVGELVVTRPMPSMPVGFWNDPDGARYRAAYFDDFPGVWRHGDWITLTDHGSVIIHGRSDATLNRNGIRMGSGDLYRVVEALPQVSEALVLGVELPDGGYWMPLFVALAEGCPLDDALRDEIVAAVRRDASPRHVPDEIVAVPGVPHTRTGKKLEVPLKRLFSGGDLASAMDRGSVDSPELVDWFVDYAARRVAGG